MNIEKNGSNSINNTQKRAEKFVISSYLPTGCMRKVTYDWVVQIFPWSYHSIHKYNRL
jgi:hypothetical protein